MWHSCLPSIQHKTVVAFEDLYHNDVKVVSHADINDEDQSIYYPEVTTNAEDGLTKDHTGTIDEKVTIKDVVTYSNVIPGKKYTISGTLMNKATGEVLYDQAGNGLVAKFSMTRLEMALLRKKHLLLKPRRERSH